jgi:hypothetical protein
MSDQPRCPVPGCFVVYRGGPDRLCPIHQAERDDESDLIVLERLTPADDSTDRFVAGNRRARRV